MAKKAPQATEVAVREGNIRADISRIHSSFNDLLIYNDQGQPNLDINRLVYKPKKKHEKEKEKLRWYLPDYLLIISNFLSLAYSSYYFLQGLTIISWRNSMQSFAIKNCSKDTQAEDKICALIIQQYGDDTKSPYTILRFAGFSDPSYHGLMILSLGILNSMNVLLGIHACLNGNTALLHSHLGLDLMSLLMELLLISILTITGHCDKRDIEIISAFLQRHVENYAKNDPSDLVKKDTVQLDRIQLYLTCCGVGNWTDFLPRSTWTPDGKLISRAELTRLNLDKTELIIPSSCCRQWWVRNLYCAHSAHLWAYPTTTDLQAHQFRERVSQWGCLPKMVGLCRNMKAMVGMGSYVACGMHFLFSVVRVFTAIILSHNIRILIRERKRIFQDKENNEAEGAEGDDEMDLFPGPSSLYDSLHEEDMASSQINTRSQMLRSLTEKTIAIMKSRRDLNKLKSATKGSHIEKWIAQSHAFVEGNVEELHARKRVQ